MRGWWWVCVGIVSACGGTPAASTHAGAPTATSCPERLEAPDRPPGTTAEHRLAATWIRTLGRELDLDTLLLDDAARDALSTANDRGPHRYDLGAPLDVATMQAVVARRHADIVAEARAGAFYDANGEPLGADALGEVASVDGTRSRLHRAREGFSLRCTAREAPYYRSATDRRFDRNRCSYVEPGELVQTLGEVDGQALVRTASSFGYVKDAARALGPVLGEDERETQLRDTHRARATFTRRHVIEHAFTYLGHAYGWGGENGGLDCSSFVQAVLSRFGVTMPRHSADQADAASFRVDVPASLDDEGRARLLDEANRRGLVLVHFPGHVMLYLGRNEDGEPMAIHAYAEYVEPCATPEAGRTESLRLARGVDVTTLELGRGTSRKSYLERMTSLSIFGASLGADLTAASDGTPATAPAFAPCTIEDEPSIFRSPRRPHRGGALRLVWVGERDPGPTAVTLTRDDGRAVTLPILRIDGPSYGLVATWDAAEEGHWTAWFGNGSSRLACENIVVAPARGPYVRPANSARNTWTPEMDSLWSVFVARLFDYPIDDRTWPNLQALLVDRERNLLFDHFTADEESRLALEPDCADLPFMLRSYFAWKMGVPFGVRSCSRGSSGSPPSCSAPVTNVAWPDSEDDPISDFRKFVTSVVASTVHSASVRTAPRTNQSDLYPVPLTRAALRPGTVYADPYGHVMMVVRWVPAPPSGSGMLVAADAQPDGTIGRPRFWRGTFLFTPSTTDVGAGFKAFRPLTRRGDEVRATPNEELRGQGLVAPYSTEQYEGDVDAFYDRVEALIDPQPLDAETRLGTLIDALLDSVERRTISVDNAERWVREHPGATIPMPTGVTIFQTEGPWEDYSTPSRDMRLLLALDTVLTFPDAVLRRPERFGLAPRDAERVVASLRARLESELRSRSFRYVGTGGATTTLTLADVRDRIAGFEVAYDPNDCPEIRWAAPEGSAERARCARRAPAEQQQRIERYRSWFATRTRPVR